LQIHIKIAPKSRITKVEATVVQKFNIAVTYKRAVYRLSGSFFVTTELVEVLDKQKNKFKIYRLTKEKGFLEKINTYLNNQFH
jgi:hypothetical protein